MFDCDNVLFEIPIYSMNRKTFDEKFDRFIKKQVGSFSNDQEIVERTREHYFPMGIWQFNQITGYIQIVTTEVCFKLLIWNGNKKRYGIEAKSKPMISLQEQCYVGYISGDSNEEFFQLLRGKILSCSERYLTKNRYIDITSFDNLAPYVDFMKIIEVAKARK